MRRLWLIGAVTAACAAPAQGYRPVLVRTIDTESDKLVAVVEDARLEDDEARPIDAGLVARGMLASGLFSDDDVSQLAAPLAGALSRIGKREYLRLVGWVEDAPRVHYVYLHGGKLRFLCYRGGTLMDTAETTLPQGANAADESERPSQPAARGCAAGEAKPARIEEGEARRRLRDLNRLLERRLISRDELQCRRKQIFARF